LAKELVQSKPDLIIANSPQPVRAAKNATSEIPIVMLYVADPVGVGLVQSLARPGGNLTGVTTLVPGGTIAKSLQLLKELVPTARRIAVLINPTNEVTNRLVPMEAPPAAAQLGFQLDVIEVREIEELAGAVARAKEQGADALSVPGDPMFHVPPNRLPAPCRLKLKSSCGLRSSSSPTMSNCMRSTCAGTPRLKSTCGALTCRR
jgi:putative ABC transport system substrate-binding protein